MRFYFVVLLAAITLVASAGTQSTAMASRQVIGAQRGTTKEIVAPTMRCLRKKETEAESEGERTLNSPFSSVEKVQNKAPSLVALFERLPSVDKSAFMKKMASLERLDIITATKRVPYWIKKFSDGKAGRLIQYNWWIWGNKKPGWVEKHFPAFFKGYDLFYHNRMTRGYAHA